MMIFSLLIRVDKVITITCNPALTDHISELPDAILHVLRVPRELCCRHIRVWLLGHVNPQVFITGVYFGQRALVFDLHHALGTAESLVFV